MNRKLSSLALLAIAAGMASCSDDGNEPNGGDGPAVYNPTVIELTAAEKASVSAANDLAYKTFGELYATDKEQVVFSPLSAQMAMSMAANGATDETLDEMLQLLNPGGDLDALNSLYGKLYRELPASDARATLSIANSVWHANSFTLKDGFKKTVADVYGAPSTAFNGSKPQEAADAVNSWISKATKGLIPQMVSEQDMVAYLIIDALYFKAAWAQKFDKDKTAKEIFNCLDNSKSAVMMMRNCVESAKYARLEGMNVARLNFGNGSFCVDFIDPVGFDNPGMAVKALAAKPEALDQAMMHSDINMRVPRMKFEYFQDLVGTYAALGIKRAFGSGAQFGALCDTPTVIGKILHKVQFEMNEEGSEAAAATVIEGYETSAGPAHSETPSMVLDHPFAFIIREASTGTIIFMGAVNRL